MDRVDIKERMVYYISSLSIEFLKFYKLQGEHQYRLQTSPATTGWNAEEWNGLNGRLKNLKRI